MREFFKGWLSVLLHFVLGLAGCLVYVFFFKKVDILPPILMKWRLTETVLLFIQIMPSLLVSSILIGYSLIFGLSGRNTVPRYSRILLRYLRDVFIILFFCITAYLLLEELVSPALLRFRHYGELKTHDYYDFLQEAAVSLKRDRYEEAYYKLKSSIGIWPDSKEANDLLDTAKIKIEELGILSTALNSSSSDNSISYADNLTIEKALSIGRMAMVNHDFYTAHFYAMRAYRLSPENSSYAEEAMRLAAQAWNQIEKGSAELKEEFDVNLYRSKKLGYELMQQGNFVKAYYQFIATQKMIEKYTPSQNDPDVNRFVELTRQKLLEEVFFIDEIETFSVFESIRNVSFTVAKSGMMPETLIKIGGISFISQKELQGIYGRNSEITQYNADGTIRQKYLVPFIKFIPFLDTDDQYKIRMQMQAVDRHHADIILKPVPADTVSSADFLSSMLLPTPYTDFELIMAAAEGEKAMTLAELFTFYPKAAGYGFSPHVYYREMLSRLSDVFLILILSVYTLILAWQFRIPPHMPFRARWIVIFPFLLYAAGFFVETIRYSFRLLVAMLTDYIGGYTAIAVFAAFVVLFMGTSFSFFAQRADS